MMIRIFLLLALLLSSSAYAFSNSSHHDKAGSITSAQISADSIAAAAQCSHYRVVGACFWANQAGQVSSTPYIEEYLPDMVVTVFNKPGDDPWFEINDTLDQAGKIAESNLVPLASGGFQAGFGQHSFSDEHEQNVFFKEADVIGNPGVSLFPQPMNLPAQGQPLIPYYQSMLDTVMWRGLGHELSYAAEIASALTISPIGNGLIDWGSVYPLEGKIGTSNDSKAAAVLALRAAILADYTNSDPTFIAGHVYQKISDRCGLHCKVSPVKANSDKTQFQLIYPIEETGKNTCEVFGKTVTYGQSMETKTNGAYAWIVWRYYQGCRDGDGRFIGKIIG